MSRGIVATFSLSASEACQALPRSERCAGVRARRLQMLQDADSGRYLVWTRWGRVGVAGQSKMMG